MDILILSAPEDLPHVRMLKQYLEPIRMIVWSEQLTDTRTTEIIKNVKLVCALLTNNFLANKKVIGLAQHAVRVPRGEKHTRDVNCSR